MACCKIEKLSHSFVITEIDSRFLHVINSFAKSLVTWKKERVGRQMITIPDKVYAWSNINRTEFRFHVNQLPEFLTHVERNGFGNIVPTERPFYKVAPSKASLLPSWVPKESQVPIIEFVQSPGTTKAITLQTGQGKTSTSLKCGELIGHRMVVLALGRYFSKWKSDIIKQYRLKPGKVMTVRGTAQLYNLMQSIDKDGCSPEVIIITLGTIKNYIADYASTSDRPAWFVSPCRLWELLKVGYRITDEVHQHFHTNYLVELFTHIPKAVYLSATLETDNSLINQMNTIAYPLDTRIGGGKFIKISHVVCVKYGLEKKGSLNFSGFGGSYNHSNFEMSILKKEAIKQRYFEMILALIERFHIPECRPGQRLLIFATRVELCIELVEFLKIHLPQFSVCKYTADDEMDIIEQHDITVTTLGSAGTALDILGLLTCILTTAVNSRQANIQALGRNRAIGNGEQTPMFIYLCCEDIAKHVDYHERKKTDVFLGKTITYRDISYGIKI